VAIKQLERAHLVLRYVESELINHSQLRHPHVRGRQQQQQQQQQQRQQRQQQTGHGQGTTL